MILLFSVYSQMPGFLTPDGGLNSGLMMAHCTAAALGNHVHVIILYYDFAHVQ